ncbi:hypothetical protein [Kineosporia babensis]|uniref:Uncharacterized protein n=1 Tax=Kineosporia babensis TaxID=499548 RepID=A0A9X1NJU2_9ACTN|nr:hypothetical protein [Kineosporia babensis]MCD5314496.1 hypothetical protein [Kineosporia babensis]
MNFSDAGPAGRDVPEPATGDGLTVRSHELRHVFTRYPWMEEEWQQLPESSRQAYDGWVSDSRTKYQASHRANVVARRTYVGRPWTKSRFVRLRQGFADFFNQSPDTSGNSAMGGV